MEHRNELLWQYLKENLEHSRHHEGLREVTTNIILAVTGAIFALAFTDGIIDRRDTALLIFSAILGLYGAAFSAKHEERASAHYNRAMHLRDELDRVAGTMFAEIKKDADAEHIAVYPRISKLRASALWIGLHYGISLVSIALTAISIKAN